MGQHRKVNVSAQGVNKHSRVLYSQEDFEKWYRERFDFSMFGEAEVEAVMDEDTPEYYPCIPLLLEGGYEIVYLGEDLIKLWIREFYAATLPSL